MIGTLIHTQILMSVEMDQITAVLMLTALTYQEVTHVNAVLGLLEMALTVQVILHALVRSLSQVCMYTSYLSVSTVIMQLVCVCVCVCVCT